MWEEDKTLTENILLHWYGTKGTSDQLHIYSLSSSLQCQQTATIKLTPCCHTSLGPPGCIWTLSCWLGSGWSPCPNCPESHWRRRVQWVWGNPRCSWCISCSSFSNTATWLCTGRRPRTWGRWLCWHTDACRPRCHTACRLPSRHRQSSRTDTWSQCPCRRSEVEGWSLEQEGIVDREQVRSSKSIPVWIFFISALFQPWKKNALRFTSQSKTTGRQWTCHKHSSVWFSTECVTIHKCMTVTERIESNFIKCLTYQSQEQEQNSKGIRFQLWTYSSENKDRIGIKALYLWAKYSNPSSSRFISVYKKLGLISVTWAINSLSYNDIVHTKAAIAVI